MKISFLHYNNNKHATSSLVYVDGMFFCYGLEDEERKIKVKGKTRIPNGTYEIQFRMVDSPKTERYRSRFPWFMYHLQLMNVPNFTNVYIHIGNTDKESEGCILVGNTINNLNNSRGFLGESTPAFKRLYGMVSTALQSGEKCYAEIKELEPK